MGRLIKTFWAARPEPDDRGIPDVLSAIIRVACARRVDAVRTGELHAVHGEMPLPPHVFRERNAAWLVALTPNTTDGLQIRSVVAGRLCASRAEAVFEVGSRQTNARGGDGAALELAGGEIRQPVLQILAFDRSDATRRLQSPKRPPRRIPRPRSFILGRCRMGLL